MLQWLFYSFLHLLFSVFFFFNDPATTEIYTLSLHDALPISRVRALVGAFRSAHPETGLNLHFHNTRGTGLANVLAALELGVADFDASVGGLGGCPYAPGATGNIATEELVHMVEDMGVATGIDLAAMIDAAADAERIIGRQLPSQVLRAGPRTRTIPA